MKIITPNNKVRAYAILYIVVSLILFIVSLVTFRQLREIWAMVGWGAVMYWLATRKKSFEVEK